MDHLGHLPLTFSHSGFIATVFIGVVDSATFERPIRKVLSLSQYSECCLDFRANFGLAPDAVGVFATLAR
jgi:hypothetical protein